jgi:hypothetical protein
MSTPEEIELDADANRIDRAVADIERYRQEIQMPHSKPDAAIADLLAETKRCQRLTELEIDNVIAETEARREAATKPVGAGVPASVDQKTVSNDLNKNASENDGNVLTRKPTRAEKRAQREAELAAKQLSRRRETYPLPQWQLFAVGFIFGAVCFVAAVALFRYLGYPSSGLVIFWLFIVPAATFVLLRRFGFGEAQKT